MRLHTLPKYALFLPLLLLALTLAAGTPPEVLAQTATDRLTAARRLEFNGEYEAAESVYQAAQSAGGESAQTARLELARLYERWERYTNALDTLQSLTTGAAPARAWLQQGSVLQALGRNEDAIAAYRRYVEMSGTAAAYARVETAKMQAAGSDNAGVLTTLAPLLEAQGPENAHRVALRVAAPAAESLGGERWAQALSYYRAHAALATTTAERTPSLWKTGELARAAGDTATAVEAYSELVTSYPGSEEAQGALDGLAQLGRPAGTLQAALVHYRRGNNETARRLYNEILSSAPAADHAVALFYLGALAERRDEPALAIENYTESFDTDPQGRLAVEALWARANVREAGDNTTAAQTDYALIVERNADFSRIAEAAFRNGNISYEAGQLEDARRRWTGSMNAARTDVAATSAFWAGRAAADLGDQAGAQTAWGEAVRRDPTGYYGLRAAAMLAGQPGAPRSGPSTLRLPASDWTAAEGWLVTWAGPEDAAAWSAVQASEDWRTSWELAEAGWSRTAQDGFLTLLRRNADKPWLQYRAGRALAEGGFPRAAFTAGANLSARAPAESPTPTAIMHLRYPAPWSDLVQRFADERGLDPLLLYAMMRQESAFDPHAGSSAGAFGLTQFIEGTAMDVARALGKDVPFTQLARPALAIEFGAFYLASQVRQFDGNVYQGLAAYNGGGGNSARWRREAGDPSDVDRFQEEIDFSETESYIRLVMENYAWYRALYGAAERPSIVR